MTEWDDIEKRVLTERIEKLRSDRINSLNKAAMALTKPELISHLTEYKEALEAHQKAIEMMHEDGLMSQDVYDSAMEDAAKLLGVVEELIELLIQRG